MRRLCQGVIAGIDILVSRKRSGVEWSRIETDTKRRCETDKVDIDLRMQHSYAISSSRVVSLLDRNDARHTLSRPLVRFLCHLDL